MMTAALWKVLLAIALGTAAGALLRQATTLLLGESGTLMKGIQRIVAFLLFLVALGLVCGLL